MKAEIQIKAVSQLQDWIRIPSIRDSHSPASFPLGEDIDKALDYALEVCQDLGMSIFKDPEGYYGYAEVGCGDPLIVSIIHVDVVPEGDLAKWTANPFDPIIKDGYIYGRGSQDDKGPGIATIYGLKALMEEGLPENTRFRIIFGIDEETNWECVERYRQLEEQPTAGFVPDGMFPLIQGEKGLWQIEIKGPGAKDFSFISGEAANVVPSHAYYYGDDFEAIAKTLTDQQVNYHLINGGVSADGISVHASQAGEGDNAILRMVTALNEHYSHPLLSFLDQHIGQETNGFSIFGHQADQESGELTMSVGLISITEEASNCTIDLRTPVTSKPEQMMPLLQRLIKETGLTASEDYFMPALYYADDSPLVKTLLKVYRDHTGDNSPSLVVGSATYAKTLDNMLTFGPFFPGTEILAHEENERYLIEDMIRAIDIYKDAFKELAKAFAK